MDTVTLHTMVDGPLVAAGWDRMGDDGWDRQVELDPSGLPVHLALVPLGEDTTDAPIVFLASLPVLVAGPDRGAAAAVVGEFAAGRVPVGTVVLVEGDVRYRLSHDPRLAPHSAERALALAAVGEDWASAALPDLVRALGSAGVTFEDVP